MNQNFYPNSMYPTGAIPSQSTQPPITNIMDTETGFATPSNSTSNPLNAMANPPYAENILFQNRGKLATFYMSYSDSISWRDKTFTGIIEDSGRDYAILSDPKSGKWYVLWTVYLNYVEFDEPISFR